MAAGRIFICYRRDDTAGHAGRLYDRLTQRFRGRVFMDVAAIDAGTRWADVIDHTLRECDVAVILIGRRWLDAGADHPPRLHLSDDPVRAEILAALRLKLTLVPVLVGGAAVPQAGQLTPDLAAILDWQVIRLDDDEFDHDASRLVAAIERCLPTEVVQPPPATTGAEADAAPWSVVPKVGSSSSSMRWVLAAAVVVVAAGAIVATMIFGAGRGTPTASASISQAASAPTAPSATAPTARSGEPAASNPSPAPSASPSDSAPPVVGATGARPVSTQAEVGAGAAAGTAARPRERLAGTYLLTGFSEVGTLASVSGSLVLTRLNETRLRFQMELMRPGDKSVRRYRGVADGNAGHWLMTTNSTNDPKAAKGPVDTKYEFDGGRLTMENVHGQLMVWKKQ